MKEHLDHKSRKAIIDYRIDKSAISLREAVLLADNGFYDNAVTRLYYACYYIASALLIKNKIEATTHVGVKRMLSLYFIVPGHLNPEYIRIYSNLLNGRQLSDYEDFIFQNKESFEIYYSDAVKFCDTIKKLIDDSPIAI